MAVLTEAVVLVHRESCQRIEPASSGRLPMICSPSHHCAGLQEGPCVAQARLFLQDASPRKVSAGPNNLHMPFCLALISAVRGNSTGGDLRQVMI